MRSRRIKKQIWLNDDEDYIMKCKSEAVGMNSSDYIRHLIVANETFGQRLLSIHNLRFLIRIAENIRNSIKEDNFLEYKEKFINRYRNNN